MMSSKGLQRFGRKALVPQDGDHGHAIAHRLRDGIEVVDVAVHRQLGVVMND